jgi:polyisoprenyl-phosphate glycosyltransferase
MPESALPAPTLEFAVLIPVFNDWKAAAMLLRNIDSVCATNGLHPNVLLVDDGSADPAPQGLVAKKPDALRQVEVLELYRNLGHQRAICIGMVHLSQKSPDKAILVMDADGEDSPDQIPTLIRAYLDGGERSAVFASRRRRTEGLVFKAFYQVYRLLHLAFVGFDIRIGNFSIIPPAHAVRLVRSGDLWNHYAASMVKARLPLSTVPIDRARRLHGRSQMNFVSLSLHGLSAMSVYSEVIGIRILILGAGLVCLGLLVLIGIIVVRGLTTWAIPGWATNSFGLTLMLIFQILMISLLFTFGVLASRASQTFIPVRDCLQFVLSERRLFP